MSDLSLKIIREEYKIARQKDEVFNMESFLKRNEEKIYCRNFRGLYFPS